MRRGSMQKKGNRFYAVISTTDPTTGKRRRQWTSVEGGRKDAERKLTELLSSLDKGSYTLPHRTTIAKYLERWLADYARPNLAPRTAEGYEFIVRRHIVPALGSVKLTQLTPAQIQHYLGQKRSEGSRLDGKGTLSARTIRHHYMVLHKALQTAVKMGLISRNPTDGVDTPTCERTEMHTLDAFDLDRFLDAARGSPYYPLFFLLLTSGMRRSEVLALRWQDVDLILGRIHVTRALHSLRDGSIVIRDCKTQRSRRTVHLPGPATMALREYRHRQERLYAELGQDMKDSHLVFCRLDVDWTPEGPRCLLPNSVTHAWVKLARSAGFPGLRLHDARHTHVSLLMNNGARLEDIAARLGHSTISTTVDIYGHLSDQSRKEVADKFGEILNRRGAGNVGVPSEEIG